MKTCFVKLSPGSGEEQHGSEAGGEETQEGKDELGGEGDCGSDRETHRGC